MSPEYQLEPMRVARTLLERAKLEESGLEKSNSTLSTPDGRLFRLTRGSESFRLESPLGVAEFSVSDLEDVEPDPLWESAHGICSHMEEDHADTFGEFLRRVGSDWSESEEIKMPWVERSGFFLSSRSRLAFVPFPEICSTPNDVRKTLILMLREGRT